MVQGLAPFFIRWSVERDGSSVTTTNVVTESVGRFGNLWWACIWRRHRENMFPSYSRWNRTSDLACRSIGFKNSATVFATLTINKDGGKKLRERGRLDLGVRRFKVGKGTNG